LLLTVIVELHV